MAVLHVDPEIIACESGFEDLLVEVFESLSWEGEETNIASVRRIAESGYLSDESGVVVRMADGSEFMVTARQVR